MCIEVQPEDDISAYTYERTLMMEQRNAPLAKMHLKKHSITVNVLSAAERLMWKS
jgi:hypothetical protein